MTWVWGPVGVGLYLSGEFITIALTVYFYGRYGSGKLSPFAVLALGLATSGIGHIYMTYPVVAWSLCGGWCTALATA